MAEVSLLPHPRFSRPCLVTADDARRDTGGPLAPLAPVFARTGARHLAATPFLGTGALFVVERRTSRRFEPEDWQILASAAVQAEAALERLRLFAQVRELSLTDPLTRLPNRRQLLMVLERSIAAARRGDALTLAMLDLDGFKAVNDRHGHQAGDEVLLRFAGVLAREARESDLVVRYGGDEFLIVMPGADAASAEALLRRIRLRLQGEIPFSAGVAEHTLEVQTSDQLIAAADAALYRTKHAGSTADGRSTDRA